jgi:hypothetical protein
MYQIQCPQCDGKPEVEMPIWIITYLDRTTRFINAGYIDCSGDWLVFNHKYAGAGDYFHPMLYLHSSSIRSVERAGALK